MFSPAVCWSNGIPRSSSAGSISERCKTNSNAKRYGLTQDLGTRNEPAAPADGEDGA
ncbi:MAG: hypothetical protein LBC99_06555 [Spirochaetota bacterium]|nr:hypothetical protein [Spirochaetota bacterium]